MRILDTDTCIEILRGNQKVLQRRESINSKVLTTWITAAELYFGAAISNAPEKNRETVRTFLDTLDVLGLDSASSQIFGEAKTMLRRAGIGLADADLFIGAIAVSRTAIVVTGNQRHYERIPGLIQENWIR